MGRAMRWLKKARKALRALKSLVKLQALVRGYLVRKQAATTLHRLQALMRLQASSQALKNLSSSRRSIEQVRQNPFPPRIVILLLERKTSVPVVHRRRLSEGGAGDDRSPRIVEMDTCQLRFKSSEACSRVEDYSEMSDEVTRDYYLDQLW
ncbi:Protein IQ-DOMAIN 31 [Triticum urartu]|uniref:Protein IQ-DOMAIN 31 n=1 Tax=Triticum urartu TaxID=4572 RepID=M8ASZ3_TRIUA|nr:Protein IQ-DOMAIN 31 [Triticum urartu]